MSSEKSKLLVEVGRWGFVMRAAVLLAGMLLVFGVMLPVGNHFTGIAGAKAAGLATLICLSGGLLGLGVSQLFAGTQQALHGMLAAMFLQSGLPLAIGVAVHLLSPAMAEAGMIFYLLASYLVALAIETLLGIAQAQENTRSMGSR